MVFKGETKSTTTNIAAFTIPKSLCTIDCYRLIAHNHVFKQKAKNVGACVLEREKFNLACLFSWEEQTKSIIPGLQKRLLLYIMKWSF